MPNIPGPPFPDYPDAGEPCVNNTDLVLIARCVNGTRQLMWVWASEIAPSGNGALAAGGCAKAELIRAARELKWSADEALKALG